KKGEGDSYNNLLKTQAQGQAGVIKPWKEAEGEKTECSALIEGTAVRGAFQERAAGGGLSQRQERRVALCRQGRQPQPGHEAVPRRQDLSSGLRRLQAPEGEAGVSARVPRPVHSLALSRVSCARRACVAARSRPHDRPARSSTTP